ncbi:MAG: hydrogenase maturation nickel metallochaperone HypA, partial [Candidatus Margulisiibacteriota bacterium]
ITKIIFSAGVFTGIEKECLLTCFNELKKNTPASDTKLEINIDPAILSCKKCSFQENFDGSKKIIVACPKCGSQLNLKGGDGMKIISIEVDDGN